MSYYLLCWIFLDDREKYSRYTYIFSIERIIDYWKNSIRICVEFLHVLLCQFCINVSAYIIKDCRLEIFFIFIDKRYVSLKW